MQTSFYKSTTPTTCNAKDCTRCIKKHGTCPVAADGDTSEEVAA